MRSALAGGCASCGGGLPDGLSYQPSEATGTVIRPAVLEAYARRVGFAGIEVLPIEDDFFPVLPTRVSVLPARVASPRMCHQV